LGGNSNDAAFPHNLIVEPPTIDKLGRRMRVRVGLSDISMLDPIYIMAGKLSKEID
jgi:hypothetical protein